MTPRSGVAGHARVELTSRPTPVQPLDRLARALGRAPSSLWVKRDDLTALGCGGNKVRKLEYVVADALAQGATHLVTGAGVQSNAARATAAAAAQAGLGCHLVLDGEPPVSATGNLLLDALFGAVIRFEHVDDHDLLEEAIAGEAERLRLEGHRPYVVPVGASTPLGSLGYVDAAAEIVEQVPGDPLVVVATGSAGTHAGLAAGLGDHARVIGVRVGTREALDARVHQIAAGTAALADLPEPAGWPVLVEDQLGDGYGEHTPSCHEAMALAAREEGLVLDPVYTGKAMAGLVAAARNGSLDPDVPVVFLHTGGAPGLFSRDHAGQVAEWLTAP